GGSTDQEDFAFTGYLNSYKAIAEDSLFGGKAETFRKFTSSELEQTNTKRIEELFKNGLGLISYFGHSAANVLAYNLSDANEYENSGKYPFFNVSGCSAGNFFNYEVPRLNGNLTISENFVLAKNKGSIGFLASTHLGLPSVLNSYNTALYRNFSRRMYGNTVGNQIQAAIKELHGDIPFREGLDYFTRMHLEEITLHGDPAIKIFNAAKPDFIIEDQLVKINPSLISVATEKFNVTIKMMNMGRAIKDSIRVTVKRKLPDGSIKILYNSKIPAINYMDSIILEVVINKITDKGFNQLQIVLDADNAVDELSETNNTLNKDFVIFEDELRPAYPYNYAIINQQNITYSASTADPVAGNRQYLMEIDTIDLFTSPFKKQYSVSGAGGLIQFTPGNINFTDSTVYYWRVSIVPVNSNTAVIWNTFSFVYLANGSTGFNQSHYYQHLNSSYTDMQLATNRKFSFNASPRTLAIKTGLYPYFRYDNINVYVDSREVAEYGCQLNSLQFIVYDSITLQPWQNKVENNVGRFGSFYKQDCLTTMNYFEFPYFDPVYRKRAMDFIDSIPAGMYVSVTNLGESTGFFAPAAFIEDWKKDTLTLGSGKSLYHKLFNAGFTQLDSFTKHRPFAFLFRKNTDEFSPKQIVGVSDTSYISAAFPLNGLN
ncbi:MAG: C25 family cysteine peptidase, partial [Bacteroidota bacterium]